MKKELEFNKNEDALKLLLTDVKKRLEKVKLGGGKKKDRETARTGQDDRSGAHCFVARQRQAFF